jgi:hypothetical protein
LGGLRPGRRACKHYEFDASIGEPPITHNLIQSCCKREN